MKKRKTLIPMPRSKFVKVRCPSCGNEQVIFDHATFPSRCLVCGVVLVVPSGGKSKILGELIKIMS
ncbi:MAG: 30S ribosomal protein S27e [Sulfolobales archaeon]|nr:30S ribosomal protein S27e [Sulfolobales archaeon]MCX8185737.1 30S ribosomal protein S27e [Sulfolobales archaeon]MDW7970055.1 30S ribosomal protein S27e [Sulfolobales archaeon]